MNENNAIIIFSLWEIVKPNFGANDDYIESVSNNVGDYKTL